MIYFLGAIAIVAWICLVVYAFFLINEDKFNAGGILLCAWLVVTIVIVTLGVNTDNDQGPCLRYETGTHYNPATRTIAPYRRCVERGEWIGDTGQ
jgi:hypothetical protein